ncbi:MAG: hypothetical protein ABSF69_18780 [Polyangiaceae bacterium]|jgi:hypothetical protein
MRHVVGDVHRAVDPLDAQPLRERQDVVMSGFRAPRDDHGGRQRVEWIIRERQRSKRAPASDALGLSEQHFTRAEVERIVVDIRAARHLQVRPGRDEHEPLRRDLQRGLHREVSPGGVTGENQRRAAELAAYRQSVVELRRPRVLRG